MNFLVAAALFAVSSHAPATPSPPPSSAGSGPWQPADRMAAQKAAMNALAFMDGAWRGGPADEAGAGEYVQTERVGALLSGTIKLVERHGFSASGETVFNAFEIISFDPVRSTYSIRSYVMGYAGDYPLTVTENGFSWSHPMGPGATLRYQATITGDEWHEIGERVSEGAAPVRMFELRLRRHGDAGWSQANAGVSP